jgi:hypothetical protein
MLGSQQRGRAGVYCLRRILELRVSKVKFKEFMNSISEDVYVRGEKS